MSAVKAGFCLEMCSCHITVSVSTLQVYADLEQVQPAWVHEVTPDGVT